MKKISFLFVILVTPLCGFSQPIYWKEQMEKNDKGKKWVDKINQFIRPKYVILKTPPDRSNYIVFNDARGAERVLAAVADTINGVFNKIYVFGIDHDQLKLVDTSLRYEAYGTGPFIEMHSDTMTFTQRFHGGYDKSTYVFQTASNRFILSSMEEKIAGETKDINCRLVINVADLTWTFERSDKYDAHYNPINWVKKKVYKREIPHSLLYLSGLKQPDFDEFKYFGEIEILWRQLFKSKIL